MKIAFSLFVLGSVATAANVINFDFKRLTQDTEKANIVNPTN